MKKRCTQRAEAAHNKETHKYSCQQKKQCSFPQVLQKFQIFLKIHGNYDIYNLFHCEAIYLKQSKPNYLGRFSTLLSFWSHTVNSTKVPLRQSLALLENLNLAIGQKSEINVISLLSTKKLSCSCMCMCGFV